MNVKKFENQLLQRLRDLKISNKKVLLAVSTGVDSMVLLSGMLKLSKVLDVEINVAYIDHQLREQSKEETKFIKEFCFARNIPLYVYRWEKEEHPVQSIEAAAREVRYNFFERVLKENNIEYLVTAHHGDDQAETFLMKLIRGGNIQQLQAIQSVRIFREDYQIVRPMLIFNKKEIYDYAKQLGIKYYEDETNKSDDYQRNRLRHHIIPVLKAENPEFLKHVLEYTQQLTNNLQAIQEVADVKLNKISKEETLDYDKFVKESPLWQRILLERYLEVKGLEIKETQVQQILAMLNDEKKPQAKFDLNEKFEFYHEYLEIGIRIKSTTSLNLEENFELKLNQWHNLEEGKKIGLFKLDEIELMPGDETLVVEDNENWVIRHRQPGDSLKMSFGNQKIKKVFIDKKIPSEQRNKSWLITKNKNEVYWILETKKTDLSLAPQNAKIHYILVFRKK